MKADEALQQLGLEFEIVVQENPTLDCDDAARERGVETSQIVKSLIIESDGELLHACITGDRTLSEKKIGAEYRLVDPEKSKELTGFESGTVHPLSTDLKHLVDERVLENDRVSFTTGDKDRGVIIDTSEFRKAMEEKGFELEIDDFVVTEEEDVQELEEKGISSEESGFIVDHGYRKNFLKAAEEKDSGQVLQAIRKLHRQEIEFSIEDITELVEKAENETHMLKLAEQLAENGEIEEQEEFSVEESVGEVLEENPEALEDLENGKDSAINYLMGKVMEKTNGKANPGEAKQLITEETG
jgi:prolyl-tRNA editing enzyme YbaK/EbsC (Cys-tRNA(Pro) deacylase)